MPVCSHSHDPNAPGWYVNLLFFAQVSIAALFGCSRVPVRYTSEEFYETTSALWRFAGGPWIESGCGHPHLFQLGRGRRKG